MTLPTSDQVRQQPDAFGRAFRGYDPGSVSRYLGRLALLMEVLDQDQASPVLPELPADFAPSSIRSQDFPASWIGLRKNEVRSYLDQLAAKVERVITAA